MNARQTPEPDQKCISTVCANKAWLPTDEYCNITSERLGKQIRFYFNHLFIYVRLAIRQNYLRTNAWDRKIDFELCDTRKRERRYTWADKSLCLDVVDIKRKVNYTRIMSFLLFIYFFLSFWWKQNVTSWHMGGRQSGLRVLSIRFIRVYCVQNIFVFYIFITLILGYNSKRIKYSKGTSSRDSATWATRIYIIHYTTEITSSELLLYGRIARWSHTKFIRIIINTGDKKCSTRWHITL